MYRSITLIVLVVLLATLYVVVPNNFYLDVIIRILINAVIVIGLNLLVGYGGQISLGHAGFLGIGAYATGIFPTHFGWHPFLAMMMGALITGLLALMVARPLFKLKGHYLAMATLGLGMIISMVISNETSYTGGPDGMPIEPLGFFGWHIESIAQWYLTLCVLLLFSIWSTQNLIRSPFGRALRALHGSEVAAQVVGVHVVRYKVTIFVISAVFASLMGSIQAHYIGFISPNIAQFTHSIELITMVVLGGMASIYGSIVGATLITLLPQVLASLEGWETVVYGAILMVNMIFLPMGIVPTLAAKFKNRKLL